MAVKNRRYPNSFKIWKEEKVGGNAAGGGIVQPVVKLEGFGSLQKGVVTNRNKADTYKWMLCFNLRDKSSIPNRPATLELDNSCTVSVYDNLGILREDQLMDQFHSDMGSTVQFGEINANE